MDFKPTVQKMEYLVLCKSDYNRYYSRTDKSSIYGKLLYKYPSLQRTDKQFPLKHQMLLPNFEQKLKLPKINHNNNERGILSMKQLTINKNNINKYKYERHFPSFSFKARERKMNPKRKILYEPKFESKSEEIREQNDFFFSDISQGMSNNNSFKVRDSEMLKIEKPKREEEKDNVFMTDKLKTIPSLVVSKNKLFENEKLASTNMRDRISLLGKMSSQKYLDVNLISPKTKNEVIARINSKSLWRLQRDKNYNRVCKLDSNVLKVLQQYK